MVHVGGKRKSTGFYLKKGKMQGSVAPAAVEVTPTRVKGQPSLRIEPQEPDRIEQRDEASKTDRKREKGSSSASVHI